MSDLNECRHCGSYTDSAGHHSDDATEERCLRVREVRALERTADAVAGDVDQRVAEAVAKERASVVRYIEEHVYEKPTVTTAEVLTHHQGWIDAIKNGDHNRDARVGVSLSGSRGMEMLGALFGGMMGAAAGRLGHEAALELKAEQRGAEKERTKIVIWLRANGLVEAPSDGSPSVAARIEAGEHDKVAL